jgi:tRNA pseudouridine38-40 synthase
MTATWKLVVEYAGTRYSGWQKQKNALTVAGEIERAIEKSFGPVVELGGAGRTDAGVHALAQVAHLRLERDLDDDVSTNEVLRAINAHLPADVNVLSVERAADRFHARHHAISRSYVYQIARRRTAFAKRYVWWVDAPLDVDAMRRAASACVGEHDFALFCDGRADPGDTRVRIDRAEVGEAGDLVLLRFEASHFVWRMVRRLTGTLVQVGRDTLSVDAFRRLIDSRPLEGTSPTAAWTAPASGLFLERVRFEGDAPLGELGPPFPIVSSRD